MLYLYVGDSLSYPNTSIQVGVFVFYA